MSANAVAVQIRPTCPTPAPRLTLVPALAPEVPVAGGVSRTRRDNRTAAERTAPVSGRGVRRRGRTVFVLDLENLSGGGTTTPQDLARTLNILLDVMPIGAMDVVYSGMSHHFAAQNLPVLAAVSLHPALRSGPDGGENAVLDQIDVNRLARRFDNLVIGSGDHAFVPLARQAARLGMTVWQVTGRGGVSRDLWRACSLHTRLNLGDMPEALPQPPARGRSAGDLGSRTPQPEPVGEPVADGWEHHGKARRHHCRRDHLPAAARRRTAAARHRNQRVRRAA